MVPDADGGWGSLLSVQHEVHAIAREEAGARIVACPDDGEPLEEARGVLHCRFHGGYYMPDGTPTAPL